MGLMDLITTTLATLISPVVNYVAAGINYISSNYNTVYNSIKSYIKTEVDSLRTDYNTSIGAIKNDLNIGLSDIKNDYAQSTTAIGTHLNTGLAGVLTNITDIGADIIDYTGSRVDEIREDVSSLTSAITKEIKEGLIFVGALVAEIPLTLERLTRAGFEALAMLPELLETFKKEIIEKMATMFDIDDEKLKAGLKRGFELGEEISKEHKK